MKKLLYIILMLNTCINAQTSYKTFAQQEAIRIANFAQEKTTDYMHIARQKAVKQFNTSLDRFKQCLHANCTKMEAVKAARDLAIAATAVITAMYVIGGGMKKGAVYMKQTGKWLQKPGKTIYTKAERFIYPIQEGDRIEYQKNWWKVTSVGKNQITIQRYNPIYSGNQETKSIVPSEINQLKPQR